MIKFNTSKNREPIIMYKHLVLFAVLTFACTKTQHPVCKDSESLFNEIGFRVGACINVDLLNSDPVYRSVAIKQFNSVTPENIFKPSFLHPAENSFDWLEADSLTNYCLANNKRLHGHTLIWHEQLPQWIWNFKGEKSEWEQLMKIHIQTIVQHFKGKVEAWDVVNEAFNEDGTLRNTIWRQNIGDTYLEKAFRYAHEADPDVLLFYNDFSLEFNPGKRNSVISYFNNLRNRGIQIDGIGLQMHISIPGQEASQIEAAFEQLVKNDYKIHVSELDISLNPLNKEISPDRVLFERQADLLGKIILNYKEVPAKYQYGVTFWGISDKTSWLRSYYGRNDYPLLYDDNYSPKPAYCKLKELL